MTVCLGYDNIKSQDGSGAQFQRILSISALARYFGLGFFNSEILDIDFNPGDGIDSKHKKEAYLRRLNEFIFLKESCGEKKIVPKLIPVNRFTADFVGLWIFFFIERIVSAIVRQHRHFFVSNPERWITQHPGILDSLAFSNSLGKSSDSNSVFKISLHIQRAKNSQLQLSDRYQATSWYKTLLDKIIEILEAYQVEYQVELHTDALEVPMSWHLGDEVSTKTKQYWLRGGFIDNSGVAILGAEDFYATLGRNSDEMKILRNIDPLEAWERMSKSQVLITGRSSFSFIGGLLTKESLVISPLYFNRAPNEWLVLADELSSRDLIRLENRLIQCLR